MTTVGFPPVADPAVTVVMVAYGRWDLCRRALEALAEHTAPVFEVVVVDNASTDGTTDRLADEVSGITLLRNDRNVGFGAASNQGALAARGRHLCFLNSDVFVRPGWLPPLLEILDGDPGAAAVVPRYLNPDGTLQEAGSLVGGDAATTSLGYGEDPDGAEYGFRRTIDYASAACMLVRRRDFAAVGGFDPSYPMAYYEDVDLCFTLAARGLRTVYEPRSCVEHVRGGSGTVESAVRLIESNRAVFADRWAGELDWRPPLATAGRFPHRLAALRDASCPERILVLDDVDPRLPAAIAELWPAVRVTVLGGGDHPGHPHCETAGTGGDVEGWLEGRRAHYGAVLGSARSLARLAGALHRAQPQATLVQVGEVQVGGDRGAAADAVWHLDHFDGRRFRATLVDAMSHLGVAPPISELEHRMARR